MPLAAAILTFLCAASPALEATADGIAVLELPAPKVNGINISTGIASISVADLDPDISADLRVLVSLLDENGDVIEHAQVKLIDPNDVKVTLRTKLQQGYTVTAKLVNNEIESAEDGASEFESTAPEKEYVEVEVPVEVEKIVEVEKVVEVETPVEVEKIVEVETPVEVEKIVKVERGASGGEVVYVITEVTPEQVVLEEVEEVITPPAAGAQAPGKRGDERSEAVSGGDSHSGNDSGGGNPVVEQLDPAIEPEADGLDSADRQSILRIAYIIIFILSLLILLMFLLWNTKTQQKWRLALFPYIPGMGIAMSAIIAGVVITLFILYFVGVLNL